MAQTVTAGTHAPDGGAHHKEFAPLEPGHFAPQLFWLALTFGLLYLIMKRVALPRVGEVIEERKDRIKRDLEQAEKLKAETEQALANYEQALSEARGKASTLVKDMHATLNAEAEKERATVDAAIAAKVADAEQRIAQTKAKALASVSDIASDVASAIVAQLTGKEVSKDEVRKALTPQAAE